MSVKVLQIDGTGGQTSLIPSDPSNIQYVSINTKRISIKTTADAISFDQTNTFGNVPDAVGFFHDKLGWLIYKLEPDQF